MCGYAGFLLLPHFGFVPGPLEASRVHLMSDNFLVRSFHKHMHLALLFIYITHRAGAGGCPLAQTLAQQTTAPSSSSSSYTVLLVERGGERPATSQNIDQFDQAILEACTERWYSQNGVVVATGNCMGGTCCRLIRRCACQQEWFMCDNEPL